MLSSKRFLLTLVLLVAAAVAAGYFFDRSLALEEELASEQAVSDQVAERLDGLTQLGVADSLFHARQYSKAVNAYRELTADTTLSELSVAIDGRIDHARRLIRISGRLDTLSTLASRRARPTTQSIAAAAPKSVERMPLERSRPNQYDSLTFALRKAEMQIRNLEGRLSANSGGNYLNFSSKQGNDIFYVGDVKKGKANGRGVALLSSGSRYIGEWRDNQKHGVGEFIWPDGATYEGEYEEDRRSGEGTYHFPSGEVFVGEWEDDLRNGEGVFYDEDGEVVAKGIWEDDELVEESR